MKIILSVDEDIELVKETLKKVVNDDDLFYKLKNQIFKQTKLTHDDIEYLVDVYVR
jgi:hypothetical protein